MDISILDGHKFIVFCGDHYNPLGICRSLGEEGIYPIVVLTDANASLVNHCKYVEQIYRVNSNEEGIRVIIEKYSNENKKAFILTGADDTTECLDQHYDELINHFYFYNDGRQGYLTYNNLKDVQCAIAEKVGIKIPKGEVLKRGQLPKNLNYPILTKVTAATKGAWKGDVHICYNDNELLKAYESIRADEILAQEYIVKKNELCVDGISINGGEEVFISYTSEYIRFTKEGYGNYMWFKEYDNEAVKEKIKNIIRATNYTGIFCLECLIDKYNELYFLECNYRNSGWSYAHTFGGVNLPVLWAKAMLENHIDYSSIRMRQNPFTAMAEFGDFVQHVKTGEISFWRWFSQFLKCDVTFTYNPKDKLPFVCEIVSSVKNKITRIF